MSASNTTAVTKPGAEQGTVASDVGTQKRSIQLKFFNSDTVKRKVVGENVPVAGGQIAGTIWAVGERVFTNRDGTTSLALYAEGDFEAMNYETGEVAQSNTAYLPGYYLETVRSLLYVKKADGSWEQKANTHGIGIFLELVVYPTGKTIPFAYEVKNLTTRAADDPLSRLKEQAAKMGRLRLPKPVHDDTPLITQEAFTDPNNPPAVPAATPAAEPAKGARGKAA